MWRSTAGSTGWGRAVAEALLTLHNIRRSFASRGRRVLAVDGVGLSLALGEILGLVGESGSGKSTVGRIAAGLTRPEAGRIEIGGTDLATLPRSAAAAAFQRCQMVFQDPYSSLNPRLTVGRQIAESLRAAGWRGRAAMRTETEHLFDLVGLTAAQADRYPHEFSGGQRQRVAIARALAPAPAVIVADEAVSALDVTIQAQILTLISELSAREHLAFLFISHDIAVVAHLCQRIAVMHRGRIVETGSSSGILGDPRHPYTRMLLAAVPRLDRRREGVPQQQHDFPPPPKGARLRSIGGDHEVLDFT